MNVSLSQSMGRNTLALLLFVFAIAFPSISWASAADIYVGTLAVERGKVILNRCDTANTRYILEDDPKSRGDAVAKFRARALPVYAEVTGSYLEKNGKDALIVSQIDNLMPGRNCHLMAALERLTSPAGSHSAGSMARASALSTDASGNRMEELLSNFGDDSSQCTTSGDWCAKITIDDDQGQAVSIDDKDGNTIRVKLSPISHDLGFDRTDVSVWPVVLTRLANDGVIFGVITEARTMYSGGGASSSSLALYRLSGNAPPALVLKLPWQSSSTIRACFGPDDFHKRAGVCHDEYRYTATLSIALGGAPSLPILRYQSEATSFPAGVTRSADSPTSRSLEKRDLVHVKDIKCSITQLFKMDVIEGIYMPDQALPDCAGYTEL